MEAILKKLSAARCGGMLKLFLLIFSAVMMVTATGFAADCVDNDGDTYVATCSGCTLLTGQLCTDCNDNDITVFPGGPCLFTKPGVCPTLSTYSAGCTCIDPGTYNGTPVEESWNNSDTCTDGIDNDCDGLTDKDDIPDCAPRAELCNGLDDDFDGFVDQGFNLGDPCTEGVGGCNRSGTVICKPDGSGAKCSAIPGAPQTEALGVGNTCSDVKDNDCDGLTDAADPGCAPVASEEICDGVDNNLDLQIDEGFNVGAPCTVGTGACQNTGVVVCKPDHSGTMCNVFPLAASIEGPSGPTCADGVDNDCDGLIDANDPSCDVAAAQLRVECALPYTFGKPGDDCTGEHLVRYRVLGNLAAPQVTAEFLALSPEGELLGILPGVKNGDVAHLASRLNPINFKMATYPNKWKPGYNRHQVVAPLPLLHVTARDGDAVAEAYCTMIPYLDVTRPEGAVVSVSSGDVIEVVAAIPLVMPKTLMIKVDGVDLLPQLGINPATAFPGGPYDGSVMINGQMVEVQNLVVASPNGHIGIFSSNTLTMTLKNLGGGGHIVYVDGEPVPMAPLIRQCLHDDTADAGTLSSLSVKITSPAEQAIVPNGSVPIVGEVKHGRMIASLKLSGKPVDVSGQMFTPGDGINTADQYVLFFDEPLEEVDLSLAVAGTAPLGTVQRGANKVVADVLDDLGTRAFDTQMFAVGDVLSPAQSAAIAAQVEAELKPLVKSTYRDSMLTVSQEVQNAFVAGIEKSAVDRIFQNACNAAATEFQNRLDSTIRGMNLGTIHVAPDCSCDVDAPLVLRSITVNGSPVCYSEFRDGEFDGVFELPNFVVEIGAYKRCQANGIFGECFYRTTVDVTAYTYLNDPDFKFTITENGILTNTPPTEEMKTFVIASLRYPGSLESDNLQNDITDPGNIPIWRTNTSVECWGAGVCSFFEGVADFLVGVLTFGLVDHPFDYVSASFELADFENLSHSTEPDPVGLGKIAIDNQVVEGYGRAAFSPTLAAVEITPDGLNAFFTATFDTQWTNPEVEVTPGAVLSPAPPPVVPQGNVAQNAFIVLADDTINQLFASLAESGGLKTTCKDTGKTVGDLIPTDCETITGDNDLATATLQGICHGIRATVCESLTGSTPALKATEQGFCHGVRGDDCANIPVDNIVIGLVEKGACNLGSKYQLTASNPLLFCAMQSIPPQLLINNTSGPQEALDVSLLLNDLTVAIVVDRATPGALDGELSGTPNCFAGNASSLADCYLYTACVDLTIDAGMSLDNSKCDADETGFVFSVSEVRTSGLQSGVMCGGAATQTPDGQVTDSAAGDQTVEEIKNNVKEFTPPLCAKGLELGGVLNFTNPKLIAIDTGGPDGYADYFGIIGEVN